MAVLDFNTLSRDEVPPELHKSLQDLVRPHVDSFNFFLESGLINAIKVSSICYLPICIGMKV